jgi:aryl-alcohol dehydrogenase-like predicted oxidoreductase
MSISTFQWFQIHLFFASFPQIHLYLSCTHKILKIISMQYKTLGKSDLHISRFGFGCMSLKPDQNDFNDIIDAAIDNGINYFDTADLYDKGLNETLLGKAFKGKRDKVIVATKAGNQWRADGSGWDWNPRKDYILKCADESLQRLQTDYIDLYQLHGGTIEDNIDESIEAFEILLQQGKIRYYGLSSIRPNVIREHVKHDKLVSVMTQYSLLDRRPEESTLSLLQKNNIGVVIRGSVATGLLIDKPAKSYLNWNEEEVVNAAKVVKELSSEKREPAQTTIQYVLQHPAVTSAIVCIRTIQQLEYAVREIETSEINE